MKNPFSKSKKHDFVHSDYFVLAVTLAIAFTGYLWSMNQSYIQAAIVIATGLFYIIWGTIHHAREGDFHVKIFLEYVGIALLGMAALGSLGALFKRK